MGCVGLKSGWISPFPFLLKQILSNYSRFSLFLPEFIEILLYSDENISLLLKTEIFFRKNDKFHKNLLTLYIYIYIYIIDIYRACHALQIHQQEEFI